MHWVEAHKEEILVISIQKSDRQTGLQADRQDDRIGQIGWTRQVDRQTDKHRKTCMCLCIRAFMHLCIYAVMHLCIYAFVYSCIHVFMHLRVYEFV